MTEPRDIAFDAVTFLARAGLGRRIIQLTPKRAFFSQGGPADSIFYLQKGRAKLTVVSTKGKEATITLLSAGDLQPEPQLRQPLCRKTGFAIAATPASQIMPPGSSISYTVNVTSLIASLAETSAKEVVAFPS
jgi:CRP/FNR family cyclic AMP-dependent transcriptional regulator